MTVKHHRDCYVVSSSADSRDRVEAWSIKRLPFEPKGWLKSLRADLKEALGELACPAGQSLHATYVASDSERCDAENILFYNVGSGAFSHLARSGLCFERVFSDPPFPPRSLVGQSLHYHCYQPIERERRFLHWERQRRLANWTAVTHDPLGSSTKPESVWFCMKQGMVELTEGASYVPSMFGLTVTIDIPAELHGRSINLSGLIKPIFDGIIASFHSHSGEHLREVSQRVGQKLGVAWTNVADRLTADTGVVLGRRRLVSPFWKDGVQWNPADDQCVAGELILGAKDDLSSAWTLSGALFEAAPKGTIDRTRDRSLSGTS